jgi:MarR-like DNA-binding transcriptional regulator SgrR of sgrS sRNA
MIKIRPSSLRVTIMKFILFLVMAMLAGSGADASERTQMTKQVRTYMPYTYPIDPARIFIIADMDFTYALTSNLVQWDSKKQLGGAVASEWKTLDDHTFRFLIRPGLKWSNAEKVTGTQIKASFERAFKAYPQDLRGVIQLVKAIQCPDLNHVDFILKLPVKDANLFGKIVEPQYGISYIKPDGTVDLSVTLGAFYVATESAKEVVLKKNPLWFDFNEKVADEIVIRNPPKNFDHQRILLTDSWANLAQTYSLLPNEVRKGYENAHFSTWHHPVDRVYLFAASKSLAANGLQGLLQYLDRKLNRKTLTEDLSGFSLADQVLPYGYQLHDENFSPYKGPVELPDEFKKRPVKVLCPGSLPTARHVQNIKAALTEALGIEPELQCIPLEQSGARRVKGDYDFYMGTFGLADPDPEGFVSYYFEGDAPIIPPGSDGFVKRFDTLRKEKDEKVRLKGMRDLLSDAKNKGYILPLFHVSGIGLARPEIDLSHVPTTDESVTYSKIRFKNNE